MTKSTLASTLPSTSTKRATVSKITYASLSDPGRTHAVNEDRCWGDSAMGLFIVADGIGGSSAPSLAAQLVVETLPIALRRQLRGIQELADPRTDDRVRTALVEVNRAVVFESQLRGTIDGMGSTVVCALVWDHQALIAHLGDSRAYLFRDGALVQLTKDHSTVQQLIDRGELSPEQASQHAASEELSQCVGMRDEPAPDTWYFDLEANDQLLLCSDGLSKMLSDAEIRGILKLGLPPKEVCRLLIDAANLAGGEDNVTALVVSIKDVPVVIKSIY